MFSLRTKLILLFSLLVAVVLITWLYAQQTYSAYNVTLPGENELDNLQDRVTATQVIRLSPTSSSTSSTAPTATTANPDGTNCTYPLAYWQQARTRIPDQILVKVTPGDLDEYCVNYAQSEICAKLEETSTAPDVMLRQQFIAAIMNYLSGADPSAVANTINEAYEWLRLNTSSDPVQGGDAQTAQRHAEILQSFNEGDIGPGVCDFEIIPLTQGNTPAPSQTTVGPATATFFPPTVTSTPTARGTVVIIVPTATEEPDDGPEPTWTSAPPTEPPVTVTPAPPTATEIPPPAPTDMPTPTPVPDIDTPTPVPVIETPTPVP